MKKNEKTYEQLIKLGAMSDPSQVKDILTDEEVLEMGYSLPPEDMLDKIKKACEEEKTAENPPSTTKSKKHVNIRRIILIAAVLTILSVAIAVSTTGYKQYRQNSRERVEDNAIRMSGTNNATYTRTAEENAGYENTENVLGVELLKPTYLPNGYVFNKIKIYNNTDVIATYKSSNTSIRFTQTLLGDSYSTNESIDATSKEVYSIDAHNTTITVREHTPDGTDIVWLSAVWYSNDLMHRVDSNCSREEFNMFIENLE